MNKKLALAYHSTVYSFTGKSRGKTIGFVSCWLLWDSYTAKGETESEKISMMYRSHPRLNVGCETYAITQSSKKSIV